jgi:hypothetical protein
VVRRCGPLWVKSNGLRYGGRTASAIQSVLPVAQTAGKEVQAAGVLDRSITAQRRRAIMTALFSAVVPNVASSATRREGHPERGSPPRSTVIFSALRRNPGEVRISSARTCPRRSCLATWVVAASCRAEPTPDEHRVVDHRRKANQQRRARHCAAQFSP